jgi:DNA primase
MARILPEIIDRLKAHVSVQQLVQAHGVALSRRGADLVGRCPFHEDRTPSLVVTPAKNLWHCFGCQAGGSAIDWVMRAQGASFRGAVELLQNTAVPGFSHLAASSSASSGSPRTQPAEQREPKDVQLLGRVIDYYHRTLLHAPAALDYLKRRGIGNEDLVRTFKLGFADGTLDHRLPQKNRAAGAQMRLRLQRLGILHQDSRERFAGSIVIPVIDDASAEVTDVYGRKINPRPGAPVHMYLPGSHRGVWNAATLSGAAEVILCEALIDALTFWCAGHRNVTASYGVEGFTLEHRALFRQCAVQRVLIAYDRDDAGDRAARKLFHQLTAQGFDCYRVLFPLGLDANQYALQAGNATHSLAMAIRSARRILSRPDDFHP